MPISKEEVIAFIESLSGDELSSFIEELQMRLASQAALDDFVPANRAHAVSSMGEPVGLISRATIVLVQPPTDRVRVMRLLRASMPNLTLHEAMRLIDRVPSVLREGLAQDEVEAFVEPLREAGAELRIDWRRDWP